MAPSRLASVCRGGGRVCRSRTSNRPSRSWPSARTGSRGSSSSFLAFGASLSASASAPDSFEPPALLRSSNPATSCHPATRRTRPRAMKRSGGGGTAASKTSSDAPTGARPGPGAVGPTEVGLPEICRCGATSAAPTRITTSVSANSASGWKTPRNRRATRSNRRRSSGSRAPTPGTLPVGMMAWWSWTLASSNTRRERASTAPSVSNRGCAKGA